MVKAFFIASVLCLLAAACNPNQPTLPSPSPAATLVKELAITQTTPPSAPQTLTLAPSVTLTPTSKPSATPRPPATGTPTVPAPPGTLYLSQSLGGGKWAYIPAPEINGLTAHLGTDGKVVEYEAAKGEIILLADAEQLNGKNSDEEHLVEALKTLYDINGVYVRSATYPRFRFPAQGVDASFFGVDRALTYLQIVRLKEALDLFSRPDFIPLRSVILDPRNNYIFIETIGRDHLGENYIGSRVVLLDRQSLFTNTYLLAMVIAHEGSHVLQGEPGPRFTCQDLLQREVGDQKIPNNFSNWNADQVIQGIRTGQLGAYHVSYWVLAKLGLGSLEGLRDLIYNANINSPELVNCGQN